MGFELFIYYLFSIKVGIKFLVQFTNIEDPEVRSGIFPKNSNSHHLLFYAPNTPENKTKTKTLSKPHIKFPNPPFSHRHKERERITQQWLSQSPMPFTAPHSTLRKGIWGPNSQSSHLRSSGNWDFKFLSFSRSFLS